MKERSEIGGEVERLLEERRNGCETEKRRRRAAILTDFPEFGELETRIARNGIAMVRMAGKGQGRTPEYYRLDEENRELSEKKEKILTDAGYPADYADRCFVCGICEDRGYVTDGRGIDRNCECYRKLFAEASLPETGLPVKKGFEAFDLSVFDREDREDAEQTLQAAREFTEGFGTATDLLIFGKAGVGKTYLASLIGTEVTRKGKFVVYVTVPELMQTLIYYGQDEEICSRRDRMAKIVRDADLLILDELGTERLTDSRQDLLAGIVDGRMIAENRKTVVVSNLQLSEMLSVYGERLFSRFASMRLVETLAEHTGDLRLRGI